MRLTSLGLKRYGPFSDTVLEFDPVPGRINLVLAPNGAGKSVLRAAFGELLFGIGAQTPMGFRFGYSGMQLSATGLAADGTPFAFTRRKGNKNTLSGPDDAPLDTAWLDRLLGRADNRLLAQLFALDTERLRQGGRDLLSSGGALADALLAAAGGLREASALRQSLEVERDKLAPVRKTAQRPFYQALERWSDSRRQLRQGVVRPQQWAEREAARDAAERLRGDSNAAAAAAGETLRQLERIRRVRPLLARHAAALDWLAANPDAPALPAALATRLPEARAAVARAAHALDTARDFLRRLDAEIAAIVPDAALLARAAAIAQLVEASGLAARARDGLPEAEAGLRAAREHIAAQLLALGRPEAEDPAALLPPPVLLAGLRRLVAEHAAHAAALAGFPRRLAEQEARLREAEAALARLPPPDDTARLAELLAEIRLEGDPVRGLAATGRAAAEAESRLAAALARLPAALRDPAALAALDPPDPAALARLDTARDTADAVAERRNEAVRDLDAALEAARHEQTALHAQGAPPSREALAAARARRDAGWHLIFRQLAGEPPDAAERAAYAGGQPLPLAFAEAVADADRLADARLADAERATAAERLVREIAEREAALAAARNGLRLAQEAAAAARDAWAAVIRPLGLDAAATLPEVQRILAAREAGLAAMQDAAAARAALDELRTRQAGATARLQQALGLEAALPVLLDQAEERVRERRSAESERQARLAAAAAARDAQRTAEQDRAEAAVRLAQWQAEWGDALVRLGRAPDTPPDRLEAVLDSFAALAEALRDAAAQDAQHASWQEALGRFRADHAALREALGFAPEPDPFAGVRALDRRQRAEAARAENRAALLKRRDTEVAALQQHEAALAAAGSELRGVVAAAGATTPEAAERRIALADERARQEAQRDALATELLAAGDGLSLDALREEAAAQPAGELDAALEAAATAQRQHAEQAQAHVATATALALELRQLEGDDVALRAAAGEAAAAGLIGQTLDDALLMQVAAGLLDAALGAVQQGGDDALLRRLGSAFAALTGNSYTAIASQEDERGTARLVVRPRDFPEEAFSVDQLSEGTRDQLFLALRLVAIEDHAAGGTVLPFLGDDILQSFDDNRAAAAFRALLGLSETAQVILLSHHDHLPEVARAALPPGALHLQRLPETVPATEAAPVPAQ